MSSPAKRPAWLTVRAPSGERVEAVAGVLARNGLRTVCRDARCPNLGECGGEGTATVILLGGVCTRGCAFCGVAAGTPVPPDPAEPGRVAQAAAELGWRHVVVTSVTRDDLPDGGAGHFARTVAALRKGPPGARVELLVPDPFAGPNPLVNRALVSAIQFDPNHTNGASAVSTTITAVPVVLASRSIAGLLEDRREKRRLDRTLDDLRGQLPLGKLEHAHRGRGIRKRVQ